MNAPDEVPLQDLAAAYALGALSPEETQAFEAYLAGSEAARREVAEFREAAALLALGSSETRPSPELRQRVVDAISATKERTLPTRPTAPAPRTRGSAPPWLWGALAASLVAVAGLGLKVRSLSTDIATRDSTMTEQARQLADQGQRLLAREAALASILSPGVELVQLTASGNPDPRIQLFWDRRKNIALLHASKLKPTAQGRTYQLWFIRDGKPVPSITFNVEPGGDALVPQVTVPSDGVISAAAVTEEPAGGSQQPTSPILLVGPLAKS